MDDIKDLVDAFDKGIEINSYGHCIEGQFELETYSFKVYLDGKELLSTENIYIAENLIIQMFDSLVKTHGNEYRYDFLNKRIGYFLSEYATKTCEDLPW